ncbi:MAG: hypothetical protein H0T79_04975 [Deltaproteobacteria bacterium]|nr:hypothetical protein [Deltaproteobacteria bacterium]
MSRALLGIAVCASFASGACGKKDSTDKTEAARPARPIAIPVAPPPPADACHYLTELEASSALGASAKYRSTDTVDHCVIDLIDQTAPVSLDFAVKRDDPTMYQVVKKAGARSLPGLGDTAVVDDSASSLLVVVAVRGNATIRVMLSDASPDRTAKATAIVKQIFTHL